MKRLKVLTGIALLAAWGGGCAAGPAAAADPTSNYFIYVCAESEDEVALIKFGPGGMEVAKTIPVGFWPNETEGPHGINLSPDGEYWYLSLAHGMETPFGKILRYKTGADELLGMTEAGMFPATLAVSPATGLIYCVNFNLHGLHEPSTLSVVETGTMSEVAQIPTGVMPHGARLNRDGTRLYIVNMMNDELVEYDTIRLRQTRVLALSDIAPSAAKPASRPGMEAMQGMAGMTGMPGMKMAAPKIKPTWATTVTPGGKLYIAGNGAAVILEVDVEAWEVTRTFEGTGKGVYNLGVTPDEKVLVGTYKSAQEVGFWDLESGEELGRTATTARIPHGVAISPDGLYAFVTVEGMYDEPGIVECFEIATRERVGRVEIGKQAGGIAFWKIEDAGR